MSILEAIILGLIQGLTEFIPVSSSGHLLLAHELFDTGDATLSFDIALHVGTLFALLLYFRKDILQLASHITSKDSHGRLARLIVLATIPAALAGLLLNDFIEDSLRSPVVVVCTLAGVGIVMLIADSRAVELKTKEITAKQGMFVGFAQALALIPGVSRSGITMTAGLFSGMTRKQAARFSFLLAIPIIAGSALGIYLKDGFDSSGSALYIGMFAAFLSGFAAIKFFLGIVERVGLKPFAYYRIAVASVVALIILL